MKHKLLKLKYGVKNLFNEFEKFLTVTTTDNKTLQVDGETLELGQTVSILNEDGTTTVLDETYNGEHEVTADGKKYLITLEAGVIVDVLEVIEEIPVSDEEMKKITEATSTNSDFEKVNKELETLKNQFKKLNETNTVLLSLIEDITKTAFSKPTETSTKITESTEVKLTPEEKYTKLAEIIRQAKKQTK